MTIQQLLPLGLAFIMLAVGIGLRVDDFKQIARHPRTLLIGLGNQIVLLPLIGLFLALLYTGPKEFAFGIMILAACPGGITSNLLSVLAGGNGALSVSMTAVTSLASIITVPIILGLSQMVLLGDCTEIYMPVDQIMAGIFLITGLPITIGMLLNAKAPSFCQKIQPKIRTLATLIFALIVAGAFIANKDNITQHFWDIGLFMILLNMITMALGFFSAQIWRSSPPDRITISLECGLQNVALAIFIAINILGDPKLMVPAIIYALTMNISAAVFIWFIRRTFSKPATSTCK
ncbi:MAG: bile acid:sodium symporter family protein [Terasakiella sp.]|uniref:bile acid:sodium symporter family protein n=1 Tax=unclassified Terasakiella TaxID=2614952 RepID=UPI003AFFED1F